MPHSVVFMGSPDFAIPTLRALSAEYPIAGVITQPDKQAGRGRNLTPPPVKLAAQELGLPFIQPRRLREPDAMAQLRAWAPDLIVVAAFGQILRADVLDLPSLGCINVHASLLPRWRGAAPIQAAILNGDKLGGVTIMRMDPGIDTGEILTQVTTPIQPDETAGSLGARLAALGAELLIPTLADYLSGKVTPQPQDASLATYAGMLKKEDGHLDFSQPAELLERRIRAYNPWPGAYTSVNGLMLKVHLAHVVPQNDIQAGQTYVYQRQPAIGTSDGLLILDVVQPAGKKSMDGKAFLSGAHTWGFGITLG
jgi:methionyl-tRNA formyltransferase